MSAQDDELIQLYHDASEHEEARPGAHVRSAVRAHAQMLADAASKPVVTSHLEAPTRAAANASRWKISALASVALVGLTGLLMLQFERGTPQEKEAAYGAGRADMAVAVPAETPDAVQVAPSVVTQQSPDAAPIATTPQVRPSIPPGSVSPPAAPQKSSPAPQPAPVPARPTATISPSGNSSRQAEAVIPQAPPAESSMADSQAEIVSSFPASPGDRAEAATPDARSSKSIRPSAMRQQSPAPQAEAAREQPTSPADAAVAQATRSDSAVLPPAAPSQVLPRASVAEQRGAVEVDLWQAARSGNTLQLEKLVAQGVSVNARDSEGRTALMLAAINGQINAVQKLLSLGADAALLDRSGQTAARQARQLGLTKMAELIEKGR